MTKEEFLGLIDVWQIDIPEFPYFKINLGIMEHSSIEEDFRDLIHDCGRKKALGYIQEYAIKEFNIKLTKKEINKNIQDKNAGRLTTEDRKDAYQFAKEHWNV